MPKFEKLAQSLAVAGHSGGLRLAHIAAMKRAAGLALEVIGFRDSGSYHNAESMNRMEKNIQIEMRTGTVGL